MGQRTLLLVCALAFACAPPVEDAPQSGSFTILTYNVAGLPDGLNDDQNPEVNIPQMAPHLNPYDLVVVQEDFSYTFELREGLEFPFESFPKEDFERFLGDGLNRFSKFAFEPSVERQMWELCNGGLENSNDCLAEKGFSFAEHEIADGVFLDVYNLHMDAGGGPDDEAARDAQIDQLIAFIDARPARAMVVAGDTNLSHDPGEGDGDEARLARFLDEGAFTDACLITDCPRPSLIDRVFVRSSAELDLEIADWGIDDALVDAEGLPLSDHDAVFSTINWVQP